MKIADADSMKMPIEPAYTVEPMARKPRDPHDEGWHTVFHNGVVERHFSNLAQAVRYASDPKYRAEIARSETKHHDK
jgi:hypothetical protein